MIEDIPERLLNPEIGLGLGLFLDAEAGGGGGSTSWTVGTGFWRDDLNWDDTGIWVD